ncbi:penicillin-binding protein 2 [Sphingomonas sp. BIUV-7]|uniref:Penicillin-binding protein 2 n=1 Tax=Sphingomonas natans TaxID=3063330 RepID=A0ABT8YAV3_9SPHN|nr:penicillin-binding protein 2 [Sphingomonas sp. BIUV-7]MDO6415463.1 penicillin-binding protein 2 [Sphingomonas sp. BIUV-7]
MASGRPGRFITDQTLVYTFTRRALVLGGLQIGLGGLLAGRMAWLSIAQKDKYDRLAESNRVQSQLIPPRRGWIVDRHGKPIAINRTSFRVDLIPDRLQDPDRIIDELRGLLDLSPEDVKRIKDVLDKAPGYQPVPVAENLDYERYATISLRQADLPGVAPSSGYARAYPLGAAVAHLVGYVGPASVEDYKKNHDPLLITPGFKVGKEGLERTMEPWLRGKPGAKRTEVTAHGKLVADLTTRPEQMGNMLRLTIDAGLQDFAARRMGTNSGAVTVIDVANGNILAMASMPAYDPNSFSDGIGQSEWAMASADDHLPLMNKALQGLYPPGSTVKPMVALALLRAGVPASDMVVCSGAYRVGNGLFHCWRHGGHGAIDMHRAIAQSCDIYFYTMARRIGIDQIARMARLLGMGEKYELPFRSQRYGTVPDTAWKLAKYHKPWTAADTVNSAIGQGYMLVNPLQLAVMASRIASGQVLQPRIIGNKHYGPQGPPIGFDSEHVDFIHRAMRDVVGGGGTAIAARLPVAGVEMAGKTGSAQVRRISMADRLAGRAGALGTGGDWKLRDHGHFLGFAPFDNPRYAIGVTLEHAGHGAAAAVVARDVMTWLFAPERAMATLAANEAQWGGGISERMAAETARWDTAHLAGPTPEQEANPDPATPDAKIPPGERGD